MAYQLEIHFEGTAPGIKEHRLSISAFGSPLTLLLASLRRIATQMVSSAVDVPVAKTGRFADPARNLDIEITRIDGNSLGLTSVIEFRTLPLPQASLPLWADLPERAGRELLDAIERESNGQLANSSVRKYLAELPSGITKQEYNLMRDGRDIRRVTIGDVKLTALPQELPYLRETDGNIVGVGFEPAKSEIRIRTESVGTTSIGTDGGSVEKALEMRHEKVRTLIVHTSSGARLISLKRAADPRPAFNPDSARNQIFARWDNVLRELSK